MKYHRSIRGLVLAFGVALGLIGTAGAASAQEAPPASDSEASIGDAYFVERPAPRPDPANELGAVPAAPVPATPAPVPAPVPAPTTPAPAGGSSGGAGVPTAPVAAQAATATTGAPSRATQVQGVQLERPAVPADVLGDGTTLAFTGTDDVGLAAFAVALLALGMVLIRISRPVPTTARAQ